MLLHWRLCVKGKLSQALPDPDITAKESHNIGLAFDLLEDYIKSLYEAKAMTDPNAAKGMEKATLLPWNPRNLSDGQTGNYVAHTIEGTWNDGQSFLQWKKQERSSPTSCYKNLRTSIFRGFAIIKLAESVCSIILPCLLSKLFLRVPAKILPRKPLVKVW